MRIIEHRGATWLITHEDEISRKDVALVLCTAFEGGSNYWIESVRRASKSQPDRRGIKYHHEWIEEGGELIIRAEGEDEVFRLTADKFLRGCFLAAKHAGESLPQWLDHCPDADAADLALQFALFGEIVYG